MIESLMKQFRRHYGKDDQFDALVEDVDESFTLGCRMVIDPSKRVEPEVLLCLKQLQESDQETGQVLLSNQPDEQAKGPEYTQISAMYRCAIRVAIQEYGKYFHSLGCGHN